MNKLFWNGDIVTLLRIYHIIHKKISSVSYKNFRLYSSSIGSLIYDLLDVVDLKLKYV